MNLRSSAITALLAPSLLLASPPATAHDAQAAPAFAKFWGTAHPYTGGSASVCVEIVVGGPVTPFSCVASFTVTSAGGLCTTRAATLVGVFHYFSFTLALNLDANLTAVAGAGAGTLTGTLLDAAGVALAHVRINATGLCDGQSPRSGPFSGVVTYL